MLQDPGFTLAAARAITLRPAAHHQPQAAGRRKQPAGLADIKRLRVSLARSDDHAATGSHRSDQALNNAFLPCQGSGSVGHHNRTLTQTPFLHLPAQCGWEPCWRQRGCRGGPAGFPRWTSCSRSIRSLATLVGHRVPHPPSSGVVFKRCRGSVGAQQFNALQPT